MNKTTNNGSFSLPPELNVEVYGVQLYQKTNEYIDKTKDANTVAVLSTLRGVIALMLGVYKELKNK